MYSSHINDWAKWEPARLIGHSITLLILILDVLVGFGVILESQSTSITALLTTLLVIIGGGTEVIRSKVYSPGHVEIIQSLEELPEATHLPRAGGGTNG